MNAVLETKPASKTYDQLVKLIGAMKEFTPVEIANVLRSAFEEALPGKRRSPLAEALMRGIEARERIKEVEGGARSAEETARILGLNSKQAVIDRYKKGQLLGWREKQGAIRFPVWQFREDGTVLKGLPEVLQVFMQNPAADDWAKVVFLLNSRESLYGKRPLDLLRKGETDRVIDMAQAEIE
jgi:hypothetical protein